MENNLEDTLMKANFLQSFQTAHASEQQLQNISLLKFQVVFSLNHNL